MSKNEFAKTQEELNLENSVEEQKVTLVDNQDTEYEFLILDEFVCDGNLYYALVSCDEKVEKGNALGDSEGDEITVIRVVENDGEKELFSITDADELYKVAKIVDHKFGHLTEK